MAPGAVFLSANQVQAAAAAARRQPGYQIYLPLAFAFASALGSVSGGPARAKAFLPLQHFCPSRNEFGRGGLSSASFARPSRAAPRLPAALIILLANVIFVRQTEPQRQRRMHNGQHSRDGSISFFANQYQYASFLPFSPRLASRALISALSPHLEAGQERGLPASLFARARALLTLFTASQATAAAAAAAAASWANNNCNSVGRRRQL